MPIDPAHSVARMDFVLKDAAPVAVITTADMHSRFEGRDVWVIDIDDEVIEAQSRTPLAVPAAENMAYVIYTSGTTGVPKGRGDRASERDVAGGVAGCRAAAGPGVDAVPFPAFDFSVWEIWGALLSGRRLLVVPEEVAAHPEELHTLLVDEQVSVLTQTPSAVAMLATEQLESMTLVVAGEACPPELVERWAAPGGR